MINSQDVLSNPLGSLARILYTNSQIVVPTEIQRPSGVRKADLDFLLEQATAWQDNSRFKGVLKKYKLYMDEMLSNIDLLVGKTLIFLDIENQCLETEQGRFSKQCVDDFGVESEFAKYFMRHYNERSDIVKANMRNMVFWRISPYDFPFMIDDEGVKTNIAGENESDGSENEVRIYNPFGAMAEFTNALLDETKSKSRLGDSQRALHEQISNGNYRFANHIFSVSEFRDRCKAQGFFPLLHQNYNKSHKDDPLQEDDFKRLCEAAIAINREIMSLKYNKIIGQLLPDDAKVYMLEGDIARGLLQKRNPEILPVGGKLLTNTKGGPERGVLETQALNKLSGWLTARYAPEEDPVIVKKSMFADDIQFTTSIKHPYIKTLGSPKEIDEGMKDVNSEGLALLEQDIRNFGFSISSIEVILIRLNYENFLVQTEDGYMQWRDLRTNNRINPFSISDISRKAPSLIRPSNTGSKCELHKYISTVPWQFWEGLGFEDHPAAKSGNALHEISNSLPSAQFKLLEKYRIEPLRREEYCEQSIVHEYRPSSRDFLRAKEELEMRLKKTGSKFYEMMLSKLTAVQGSDTIIIDRGKPDGVAAMTFTGEPIIIDFKRRMAMYYPVQYFFEQTSRYALAVMQSKGIDARSFYTAIIQPPFSANKFIGEELPDLGNYRNQKIRMRKVDVDGEFLEKVKRDMIIEYVGNSILKEDPQAGFHLRELYKDNKPTKFPSCRRCFANMLSAFKCSYLLTGEKNVWAEQRET